MTEKLLTFFGEYPQLAFFISIVVNILIAIIGVIPSFVITAANILFFGFWQGTAISLFGEAIGAAIAFLLYRKGFKKKGEQALEKFPKIKNLIAAEGQSAFYLILLLRLLPFVPSGLVTLGAAIGNVTFVVFLIASSIGKIPALFIEAYSVYQVSQFNWQGKLILGLVTGYLLFHIWKKQQIKK